MNDKIIADITNFIFVEDKPQKVDAIFLPGGSHPEQPEYAAELYARDMRSGLFRQVELALSVINGRVYAQKRIFITVIIKLIVSFLQMFFLKMEYHSMRL